MWLVHMCDMTHSYVWHDSFIRVTWLIVCHDSFICVTWLIHVCGMTHSYVWHDWLVLMCDKTDAHVCHDSFVCVPRASCDMIHSYVWHELSMGVTWILHMCDLTHSYVWYDSCIYVIWRMHISDMTHSYVWHDSVLCLTCLTHVGHDFSTFVAALIHVLHETQIPHNRVHGFITHERGLSHIRMRHVIHLCESCHTHESFTSVPWLIPWLLLLF